MKTTLIFLGWILILSGLAMAQSPMLKGQVRYLDGSIAAYVSIRLVEPGVEGSTDKDGVFKIRLPAGWMPGKQVTLLVGVVGYRVLRPWEGKITIQEASEEKIESVLIAEKKYVDLVTNPGELLPLLGRNRTV